MSVNRAFAERALQEGYQLHQQGQLAEAELKLRQAVNKEPKLPGAMHQLAVVLLDQKKVRDAIKLLEKAIKQDGKNPGLFVPYSAALMADNQIDRALNAAMKVTQLLPNVPDGFYNLGQIQVKANDQKSALDSFSKALQISPTHLQSLFGRGYLHYQLKQMDKALTDFEQTIAIAPEMASTYLNAGIVCQDDHDHDKAISYFQKAIELEASNVNALEKLGMSFHFKGQIDEALDCFQRALKAGSPSADLHILIANAYRDIGDDAESLSHYQKALKLDPKNQIAKDNVSRVDNARIAGWHFKMLADQARNKAYHQAIKNAVTPDSVVLDIGTGSGLLSMMAAKAGAKEVVACEMVEVLAETATQIVKDNGLSDVITIVNKKSTSMKVGEELKEKATLYVSEILDAAVVGEGVIPTTRHALKYLVDENATIIPKSAGIKAVLIESDELGSVHPISEIEGFNLSAFNRFKSSAYYEPTHLHILDHQNLSDVFPLINIDFRHLPPECGPENPNRSIHSVKVSRAGTVHAVAFWFDLNLNENLSLNSGPEGELKHWAQVVSCFEKPLAVKAGQEIKLEVQQSDLSIRFALL